ncbi:hypothetical protein D1007_04664 [Hordeum vulgare]|nr:hypothetical protein D1007_04664 [Hordeum vulgare]
MELNDMAKEAGERGAVRDVVLVHKEAKGEVCVPAKESARETPDDPQNSYLARPMEMVEKQQARNPGRYKRKERNGRGSSQPLGVQLGRKRDADSLELDDVDVKVEELMDPFEGGWDEALVKDIFGHQDSELILAIPIRPDMDDTWAWFPDHRGIFSVRSAYQLCRQVESVVSGEQGTCDGQLFKWQTIWDAPCPLKIQQFLWRTAHNSLPVRRNLVKKGVNVDTICPVCHRFDEDGAHMFLKCKPVKKLWWELQLEEQRAAWAKFDDPRQLVESILQLQEPQLLLAISMCWNWWCTRNKINAEKKPFIHDQVLLQIRRSALEFQDFFSKSEKKRTAPAGTWQRPCSDMIKVNIDGSFFKAAGHGGWGVVAQDADGDVCFSAAGKLNHAQDALQTEAKACLKALAIAQEYGMQRVQIETDAQMLVRAFSSMDMDLSPNGVLFREIRAQVFLHFSSFSLSYCPRACNRVAHVLANLGAKMVVEPQAVWPGRVPTFARDLVARDLAAHV